MSSSTNLVWRKPIAITPDSLRALEEHLLRNAEVGRRAAVSEAGFDPDAVTSGAEAKAKDSTLADWKCVDLDRSISRATNITWSVKLANNIRRSDLKLEDVIALANIGDASIEEIEAVQGQSYTNRIQVTFDSTYIASAVVKIWGDYNDVYTMKEDFINYLGVNTRNWSRATNFSVGATALIAFVLAVIVVINVILHHLSVQRAWTPNATANWMVWMSALVFSIAPWTTGPLIQKWKSIFPLVEFQFGGGINAAEARRSWRKACWTVPLVIIGGPLLVNFLSSKLFG